MTLRMRARRRTRCLLNTAVGKRSMVNGWTLYAWANKHRAIDEGSEILVVSPEPFPNRWADAYCFEPLASIHMDEEQGHLLCCWVRTVGRRNTVTRPPRCRAPLLYYDRKVGHKHGSCPVHHLTSRSLPPSPSPSTPSQIELGDS